MENLKRKSNMIKLKLNILKLFNFYTNKLNKRNEFEVANKNDILFGFFFPSPPLSFLFSFPSTLFPPNFLETKHILLTPKTILSKSYTKVDGIENANIDR